MIKNILIGNTNAIRAYFGNSLVWDSFDPLTIFAGGKQGAWYDPSDLSTLFKDAAGSQPVTADGDPVGLMRDKSGNGNHATQSVSASRPIYRTDGILHWLQFDGVDDLLKLTALDMSAHADLNIFAAAQKVAGHTSMIAEFGSNSLAGSFYFVAGNDAGVVGWTSKSHGNSNASSGHITKIESPASETAVLSIHHSIPNDLSTMRRNQVAGIDATFDKGTGNFGNHDLYIGSRSSYGLFFNSRLYSFIVSGGQATTGEVANAEQYLAKKSGVTL